MNDHYRAAVVSKIYLDRNKYFKLVSIGIHATDHWAPLASSRYFGSWLRPATALRAIFSRFGSRDGRVPVRLAYSKGRRYWRWTKVSRLSTNHRITTHARLAVAWSHTGN